MFSFITTPYTYFCYLFPFFTHFNLFFCIALNKVLPYAKYEHICTHTHTHAHTHHAKKLTSTVDCLRASRLTYAVKELFIGNVALETRRN